MTDLNPRESELVALGTAMGSNCVPCIEYHIPEARKAGISDAQIHAAIRLADLRQETLLRVARELASFEGRSAVKTWVFSIATRIAAEYFRDPGRRTQIVDMDEVGEPADPGQTIDDRVVVGEMTGCIREVIDSLPEIYRAPLILHDLENLTVAQTADICECSVSAVKIRIHRART